MDTGLHGLITIARFHKIPAEPSPLKHEFSKAGENFSDQDLIRAAKALTLKASLLNLPLEKIEKSCLPALAKTKEGGYLIVANLKQKNAESDSKESDNINNSPTITDLLIQDPKVGIPQSNIFK